MHSHDHITLKRAQRFRDDRVKPAIFHEVASVSISHFSVRGEPLGVDQVRAAFDAGAFAAVELPFSWGAPWDTSWFEIRGTIPRSVAGNTVRLRIDLGFVDDWPGNQCEGLIFSPSWKAIKAINSRNQDIVVAEHAVGGESFQFFLEAAANPDLLSAGFNPISNGDRATASTEPMYELRTARLETRDDDVWGLFHDVDVLLDLALQLPENSVRRAMILRALDKAIDTADTADIAGTASLARKELEGVLSDPAPNSALEVTAIGHAHIDSAWLWPVRETKRKVARTFSNVVELAHEYPDFTFTATSAQQYEWLKNTRPEVFDRVRQCIENGQWHPSGGMWVESDVMMPGGEALMRQFDFGIRFFEEEFGQRSRTLWLPDSFGYPASLPQIAVQMGMTGFLTQKISWNQHTKLPHSTMWWEGLDGTRVFSHFPPVNCYDSELSAEEYTAAVNNYRDKGAAKAQVIPFGYGDGGGGPTPAMMERARRLRDLEGAPKIRCGIPDTFFVEALAEYPDAPTYSGELYLEFHRGIFTSQHAMKEGNRRSEHALRELEFGWAAALVSPAGAMIAKEYPQREIDELWKVVLLNQFHDILPGSSIAWVHRVAREEYSKVLREARRLEPNGNGPVLTNFAGHFRKEIVEINGELRRVDIPALSSIPLAELENSPLDNPVRVEGNADAGFEIDNGLIRVSISPRGTLTKILDLVNNGREIVAAGHEAAEFRAFEDTPNEFDAWDIERHYLNPGNERNIPDPDRLEILHNSPLRFQVKCSRQWKSTRIVQTITLDADSRRIDFETYVDWHEKETLLKVSFPLAIHAREHAAETSFGYVRRTVAENTLHEFSRYEVPAHRWILAHDSEYGAAIANDSTYGHDVQALHSNGLAVNGRGTRISLSLLRAPLYPDPLADQGEHTMRYSLVVGADPVKAAQRGYELNLPLRVTQLSPGQFAAIDQASVHIESVRPARDGSGDLIMRIYEGTGTPTRASINMGFEARRIWEVDPLERDLTSDQWTGRATENPCSDSIVRSAVIELGPFSIATLRITPALSSHSHESHPAHDAPQ